MYYLDEIMDRTFDDWSTMLGANNYSLWASSEIEMKPTQADTTSAPDTDTVTSTPAETPAWEPADNTQWETTTAEDDCNSNTISDTLHHISDTAREVIADINPFTDRESDNT